LRVRLQESEHKLGLSMPIELAKERITQLEAEATSFERYSFLTMQLYFVLDFLYMKSLCYHVIMYIYRCSQIETMFLNPNVH